MDKWRILMSKIKKLTLGIKPVNKLFRLKDMVGTIADEIMSESISSKILGADYYIAYSEGNGQLPFTLHNKDKGNSIRFSLDDIIFIKDLYSSNTPLNTEKVFKEFKEIFLIINKRLKLSDIRRIGIVGESRMKMVSPTAFLMNGFSKLLPAHEPERFVMKFEDRFTKTGKPVTSPETDAFSSNFIEIYDSKLDTEHPKNESINFNIDSQIYFNPLIKRDIWDYVEIHKRSFLIEYSDLTTKMDSFGIKAQ
jgi:hypothetical protein